VLTIRNLKRIPHDYNYLERCPVGLAEIILDLEERYRGVTCLYLT